MGTEPEVPPSGPVLTRQRRLRAPRNTCSRRSFTQPRVLRRLERKPTAAAISGRRFALLSPCARLAPSRAWAVSDWTGCPASLFSRSAAPRLCPDSPGDALVATARGGVAAGPGAGLGARPAPAPAPAPFALRSSPADVSVSSNTSWVPFQAPGERRGRGGGAIGQRRQWGRGLYQPCPRAPPPAAPASAAAPAAPAALRSSPVTSVLGTRAPRAGRGSRGKGDRERPGLWEAAASAGRGLTSPLLPSFHTA